jgi:hypothetical protein
VQEGSFGKKSPTLIHPPSKCGRCVQQHLHEAWAHLVKGGAKLEARLLEGRIGEMLMAPRSLEALA